MIVTALFLTFIILKNLLCEIYKHGENKVEIFSKLHKVFVSDILVRLMEEEC